MKMLPYLLWIVLAVPVTFVGTFLCSPFWNWFETTTGIESYGHSGPSDWCFIVTYGVVLAIGFIGLVGLRRGGGKNV